MASSVVAPWKPVGPFGTGEDISPWCSPAKTISSPPMMRGTMFVRDIMNCEVSAGGDVDVDKEWTVVGLAVTKENSLNKRIPLPRLDR